MGILISQIDIYTIDLSFYYYGIGADLRENVEIVTAAPEERFFINKHYFSVLKNTIIFCLKSQNINLKEIKKQYKYKKNFFNAMIDVK